MIYTYMYIYICIHRERERETCLYIMLDYDILYYAILNYVILDYNISLTYYSAEAARADDSAIRDKNPGLVLKTLQHGSKKPLQRGSKNPGLVLTPLPPYAIASLGAAYLC